MLHLVIANKLYSSWSLRPWLLMKALSIPFEETVIPLRQPDTRERILAFSPTGKVPALIVREASGAGDGDVTVWESLAILEHLHECFPDRGVWPADPKARALARAMSSEMHAGFQGLRSQCPMNLRARFAFKDYPDAVKADVARIEASWRAARGRHAASGPFLFGAFSAADAMYAPVVTRLDSYSWPVAADTRAYMDAILTHAAFQAWRTAGLAEAWRIPDYEDGHRAVEEHAAA